MTIPNMPMPTAHRPWQQMGGGYEQASAEGNARLGPLPGQQPGQVPLPSALQQQMQQVQAAMPQLPPQMQALQQLDGQPSPLSYTQPNMPQPMQIRPPQMQQIPQMQVVRGADGQLYQVQQPQQPAPQQFTQHQFQQPQQQGFPPNPQYGQQPAQNAGGMILQGPGVPQELQGRSLQDVIGIYQGLRQTHLQLMAQQPQGGAQPHQQPQGGGQPQQQPQSGQPDGQRAFDWRNPGQSVAQVVDERLNNLIDQKLMPVLAPMAAQNAMAGIQNARQQAAHAIGAQRFAAMEPQIMQMLNGADPATLQNPRTWAIAAQAVAGQMALSGVQSPIIQNPNAPGAYPAQVVQPGQNPLPNINTFFTEQPNQGGPMGGGFQLSQAQVEAAQAMGIPLADYANWAVGVRPY